MLHNPLIYLASASPRRSQLLTQIGVQHVVRPAVVDETPEPGESPSDYVCRLAPAKCDALWERLAAGERKPVLGADTTVALGKEILGKPRDRAEGLAMLQLLSGQTHRVFTAVALRSEKGTNVRLSASDVTFRALEPEECDAYWLSGEPLDKAGGYAVQGLAAAFITHIAGSYSGIMGLPLAETAELLGAIGWRPFAAQGAMGLEAWARKASDLQPRASSPQPSQDSDLQPTAYSPQPADRGAIR